MTWQSLSGSQEAGRIRSRVLVLHMDELHGAVVYEDESRGLKVEFRLGSCLQWSQESSLPVSRTMVTFCGGEPTVSETVSVTLCWKESLREGVCDCVCVFRDSRSGFCVCDEERHVWICRRRKRRGRGRKREDLEEAMNGEY